MKIVLAGSPQISIEAFEEIINNFEVVAVVTQPDRPKGRGMVMTETEVASLAKKYNIKSFKPEKIGMIYDELVALDYDILLSFAFGQYIPTKVLQLGKYKPVNIHGSLLPKYRGAAPIHYAILNNDKEIGITLIEMIDKMDAGDMYFKASKPITSETTTGQAFQIISDLAKENIVNWLKLIEQGKVTPEKQSDDFTLSPKIEKEFGLIDSNTKYEEAYRKIKALNPNPGAYTFIDGKRLKLWDCSTLPAINAKELFLEGKILYVTEYQFEGKERISTKKA